ncbi:MAG TPA: TIGR02099 family protein, partial [Burkholderiales bacterium]|nr:TIGR02099 family protein [Burkholderiales bacterium]
MPEVERHRDEIAARVAAAVGRPVKIGRIEAGWLGLRPQISLADVRIYDAEGREALRLPSVENILAWRSLLYRDLRLHSVVIDGPKLTVRRDAHGALEVAGIRLAGVGDGGFAKWLLEQGDVAIRNAQIEWRDESRGAPPLALSDVNLHLRNGPARHALGLTAQLPADLGERLELRADLSGEAIAGAGAWQGRVYAELGHADLAAWRAWVDLPAGLVRGVGALRLWTTIENGTVRAVTADVAVADVAAQLDPGLAALELRSLRGRLQVRSLGDGYQITGRQLALAPLEGAALGPVDFQLVWHASGGTLSANAIDLAPLAR